MSLKHTFGSAIVGICLSGNPVAANEFAPAMQSYFEQNLTEMMADPNLVAAIQAQNETTSTYSAEQIDAMDQQWRSEVGTASTPTITPILNNDTANQLRAVVASSGNVVTEMILMDAAGLNVAVSDVTSDMWQGDEAKHQQTYAVGPDAVHFSEVEFDESTQTYQGQISFSIVDETTGEVVGAMTVGVNAESLL